MGHFLHRTTKRYHESVPPNELPEPIANYIEQPDLTAVNGVPIRYWIIEGDTVSEMSNAEKATVDEDILESSRDGSLQEIDALESTLRQIVRMTIREINILRGLHGLPPITLAQVRNQLRNGYGS